MLFEWQGSSEWAQFPSLLKTEVGFPVWLTGSGGVSPPFYKTVPQPATGRSEQGFLLTFFLRRLESRRSQSAKQIRAAH
jgi:hypothetical protein